MQSVDVIRVLREDLTIDRLGLGNTTGLVMPQGNLYRLDLVHAVHAHGSWERSVT